MSRRIRRAGASLPTPDPAIPRLRVNDLKFVDAYLACGQNGTQAYQVVHPTCKAASARASAPRLLAKASVQAELARRVRYDAGITKEWGEANLLYVCDQARAGGDHALLASATMDAMKLAGFLVEKREVKSVSDEDKSAIRALVRRTLSPTASGLVEERPSSDVMLTCTPPTGSGAPSPASGLSATDGN